MLADTNRIRGTSISDQSLSLDATNVSLKSAGQFVAQFSHPERAVLHSSSKKCSLMLEQNIQLIAHNCS